MKKILFAGLRIIRIVIVFLVVFLIVFLMIVFSNTKFAGYEFEIEGLEGEMLSDYAGSEVPEDFSVHGVKIIPEIKAVTHEKYAVYVVLFSDTDSTSLSIKKIELISEDGVNILANQINEEIVFDDIFENQYYGSMLAGEFLESDVLIENGKKFVLTVQAETVTDNQIVVENVIYNITGQ